MVSLSKYVSVIFLTTFLYLSSYAQISTKEKSKIYKVWVKLNDSQRTTFKGILYQIKDSSVIILNELNVEAYLKGRLDTISVNYDKINQLKIRRDKNIGKGALLGSVSGYIGGGLFVYNLVKGEEFAGLITFEVALYYAIIGAGVGMIVGNIKDRVPIKGDIGNFNTYRSLLEDYSYIKEFPASKHKFEHKGFVGGVFGPSYPSGNYIKEIYINGSNYSAYKGYSGNMYLGYRFSKKIGVIFSDIYNYYSVDKMNTVSYWSTGELLVGPIFSFPIQDKLFFDLKPEIGYANAMLVINDEEIKNGEGVGLLLSTSMTYNLSHQWSILAETSYSFLYQKFEDKSKGNYGSFNLNLGFTYKFSRKSL